jgi:L-proline amide hydrolase
MGACSPVPWLPDAHVDADALVWRIHQPVLDELARHLGIAHRYAVVGQSWGGMLAMDYALDHPAGLRGIVVADSPASMTLWVSEANRLRGDLPPDVQETLTRHEEAARVAGRGGSGAMRSLVLPRRGPSA